MTLHPDIQARAQAEIDGVLGTAYHRLPTFSDKDKLPYVNAIVLEILRWHPAVPLGLAHSLTQDDTYDGFFFPKGTTFWANIWYVCFPNRDLTALITKLVQDDASRSQYLPKPRGIPS